MRLLCTGAKQASDHQQTSCWLEYNCSGTVTYYVTYMSYIWNRNLDGRYECLRFVCKIIRIYGHIYGHNCLLKSENSLLPVRGMALRWRRNGCDSVSNHQPHDCLHNRLFGRRSKKTSKLRVTGLCVGNSPATGEFPAQMASNAENVSIWWRHHGIMETWRW